MKCKNDCTAKINSISCICTIQITIGGFCGSIIQFFVVENLNDTFIIILDFFGILGNVEELSGNIYLAMKIRRVYVGIIVEFTRNYVNYLNYWKSALRLWEFAENVAAGKKRD